MPFNIASIKDKATHARDASITKFRDTRDKYQSTPEAKTKFSNDGIAMSSKPPPPPPIARGTKPGTAPRPTPTIVVDDHGEGGGNADRIDWANLSPEDKRVFFSWLDEFFANYLTSIGRPVPESILRNLEEHQQEQADAGAEDVQEEVEDESQVRPKPVASPRRLPPPAASFNAQAGVNATRGPPPAIRSWSKPTAPTSPSTVSQQPTADFEISYPPPTEHGCAALDLAHYFHPSSHWDTAWYAEEHAKPPPLQTNTNIMWTGQYSYRGTQKSMNIGVFFSDLSICWFTVSYNSQPLTNPDNTERHAEYLPGPEALSKDQLVEAHETYGETIAGFAESFLGSGQFCSRGECWDLAHEALKYFEQFDYVPKPVPSLNRTHGHLIFEGKALGKNNQMGRWRGGDDRVRRGDIVEWRSVRINFVGAPRGSWATLGDPEHTAVIVEDSVPTRTPKDGEGLLPSELVQLSVVEQSRNQPPEPKRQTYDMTAFEQGEVWIYRPVSMQVYLGVDGLSATPGEGLETHKFC